VSRGGQGESPRWAAAGNQVAVLGHAGSQAQIEVVQVPIQTVNPRDSAEALAGAFANAQVGGDRDAMRALAAPTVDVGGLPAVSRASVVDVVPGPRGSEQVTLRLLVDPTPAHPAARAVAETLDLGLDGRLGRLV